MKSKARAVFHIQVGSQDFMPTQKQLDKIRKVFKKVLKAHGDVVATSYDIHVRQITK
jgi:hypothetical protein